MRQRVVEGLKAWPGLESLTADRVFEASAVVTQVKRPFIVVRMHTGFPVERGIGGRHYSQVWAHDAPGSYLRIDQILIEARKCLEVLPHNGSDGFLEARWIETGVDLKDDTLGTVCRYSRYQLTQALRELYG